MTEPTKEQLEARLEEIDTELQRLAKLANSYSVGNITVDNKGKIAELREEKQNIKRQINYLDTGLNPMLGPEQVVI